MNRIWTDAYLPQVNLSIRRFERSVCTQPFFFNVIRQFVVIRLFKNHNQNDITYTRIEATGSVFNFSQTLNIFKVGHWLYLMYIISCFLNDSCSLLKQVTSESACRLACEIENEFLCRSFIFKGPPVGTAYNCELFHLDHKTLPDGPSTYLNAERPLIDDGQKIGNYYENYCESECFC